MTLEAVGEWSGKDKPCGCSIIILEQQHNPFKLKLDIQFCKIHAEAEATLFQNQGLQKKVEQLERMLPHSGQPCYGPGCHHCDEDEERHAEKVIDLCPKEVCPFCYHHVDDPAHRACMSSDNRK